jgi:DNA-directed RNA polymerase subunit M/transcription elongation factor TFIIS
MTTLNVHTCPGCGSVKIRYKRTRHGKKKMYNCLDCGFSWENIQSLVPTRTDYKENERRMF